jgi:hypothetical protein
MLRVMLDLELAKQQLYERKLTLAIVKDGQVLYGTDSHRISGFIRAIETLGLKLQSASVADKVAGKALALLCVYSGVSAVYAEVLSRKAEVIFKQNKMVFCWDQLVDNVLDINKAGVCPFEKAAQDISDPKESYEVFKAMLEKMKACR